MDKNTKTYSTLTSLPSMTERENGELNLNTPFASSLAFIIRVASSWPCTTMSPVKTNHRDTGTVEW